MNTLRHILLATFLCLAMMVRACGAVRWLDLTHDFGTINEQDGKVSCVMRLVNGGDSNLIITQVRTSCGCTATDYDKTPIAPGDTAHLRITYNPAGRPGQFSKNVFVYTNGTPRRSSVSITGNVIARPETLIEQYPVSAGALRLSGVNIPLGELKRSRTRTSYLTAYNASATDTLAVSLLNVPGHIKASVVPDTLAPGMTAAVTVSVKAAVAPLWGLNTDTLAIVSEPLHPGQSALAGMTQIYVMAQVLDDFTTLTDRQRQNAPHIAISADKLMFTAGQPTATLTITNTGRDPLQLRRLWTSEPGITIKCDRDRVKRGKTATVTLTVNPAMLTQPVLNTRLTIVTNDPDCQSVTVRLVGDLKQ